MPQEKKRYLLSEEINHLLQDLSGKPVRHTLFFTKIKLFKEVRYEHLPGHYIRMKRSGAKEAQKVTYQKISKRLFRHARDKQEGKTIIKERYPLLLNHNPLYINSYRKELTPLYILEIPSESVPHATDILHHKIVNRYLHEEITDDPRYEEKYLALYGNPSRYPYTLFAIFKDLETGRVDNPDEIIFKEMKSADAIRILLYHNLVGFEALSKQISAKKEIDAQSTAKIVAALQESIHLIESFKALFAKNDVEKSLHFLTKFKRHMQRLHDLYFIEEAFLKLQKKYRLSILDRLLANTRERIVLEQQRIVRYLHSREFAILLQQYRLFLKEGSKHYLSYEAQLPVGFMLKSVRKSLYSELMQRIDFLDGCNDENSYSEIEKRLEEYSLLLQRFSEKLLGKRGVHDLEGVTHAYRLFQKAERREKRLQIFRLLSQHLDTDEKKRMHRRINQKIEKIAAKQKKFEKSVYDKLHQLLKRSD